MRIPLADCAAAAAVTATVTGAMSTADTTSPRTAGCPVFPVDNPWNRRVDDLPLARDSARLVHAIGLDDHLHADFGSGLWDGGPYELFALRHADTGWSTGSGAIWSLRSDRLRLAGWTAADAAGLPILPGLVKPGEVIAGRIRHAIRITVKRTRRVYVWPPRHFASADDDPSLPPMGLLRLRRDYPIAGFPKQARVVLRALQAYGAIVADNGSSWFLSGVPDQRWSNDDLHTLHRVPGSAFEVVDASSLRPR